LRLCDLSLEALPKRKSFIRERNLLDWEYWRKSGSTESEGLIFFPTRPGDVKLGKFRQQIVPETSGKIVDDDGLLKYPTVKSAICKSKANRLAAFYHRPARQIQSAMLGEWFNTGDRYYRDGEGYYYYYRSRRMTC